MPYEIKVEVAQRIDFLQIVTTTLYATTMNFSKDSSLKNHNSYITYILFFLFSFLQYYLFLVANIRKISNMTFTRFTPAVLLISSIMGSSTLLLFDIVC
jgi:hypothetical protein